MNMCIKYNFFWSNFIVGEGKFMYINKKNKDGM